MATCTYTHTTRFAKFGNDFYRFDPRVKLMTNTLEVPATPEHPEQTCPAVKENEFNLGTCRRDTSCAPTEYTSKDFELNVANMRAFYEKSDTPRLVYHATGLRVADMSKASELCDEGTRTRWKITNGSCVGGDTRRPTSH